jgi:disulfide bond formation protein DsbB
MHPMVNTASQLLQNKRTLNSVGAVVCAGMMAFALYAQHGLHLEPCPLCIFQRVAVIAMGGLFFVAAIHNPGRAGGAVYALLLALVAMAGAGVAGRQVWLQSLPPDKVPACGPGLDFMLDAFPLTEALQMVLSGSGECAEISWSLFGLSMPAWVFIALVALAIYAVLINLRDSAVDMQRAA